MKGYNFGIIRELRKSRDLTIANLAEAAGISTAVISRLERNQAVPELATLERLGKIFGLSPAHLIGLAEPDNIRFSVSRQYQSGGFHFNQLSFDNIQCFLGTASGGQSATRPEIHHNDKETCWVLEGSLELVIQGESHTLKKGEALQFDGALKHTYRALEECKILLIHLKKG